MGDLYSLFSTGNLLLYTIYIRISVFRIYLFGRLFTNCILVTSPREDGHHSLPSRDSVTADPRDADSDLSLKMVFLGREVCVVKTYVCAT